MFRLSRPTEDDTAKLLDSARDAAEASPHLLTLAEGLRGALPKGFVHDVSRSELGRGASDFAAARESLRHWKQFDLGWVRVANGNAAVAAGQLVAIEAYTAWLWTLSVSRITEVVDQPARFGFMYATTALHVEEGQERFVVELEETGAVTYLIEAFSRPRHLLARIGYPFARAMQHRFARDSHARMRSETAAARELL